MLISGSSVNTLPPLLTGSLLGVSVEARGKGGEEVYDAYHQGARGNRTHDSTYGHHCVPRVRRPAED
jgi:hypothetical protein